MRRARSRPNRVERVTLDADEVAFLGVPGVFQDEFLLLAVDRLDAGFPLAEPHDAERRLGRAGKNLDDARDVIRAVRSARREAGENAIAEARRRGAAARSRQHDARRVLFVGPLRRAGDQFTVAVTRRDGEHGDGRQVARACQASVLALHQPLFAEFRDQVAERGALGGTFDAEGASDVALGGAARMFGDVGEDFFAGGERPVGLFVGALGGHVSSLRRVASPWPRAWPSRRALLSPSCPRAPCRRSSPLPCRAMARRSWRR